LFDSVRNKEIEFYRTIDDWWSPKGPQAQLHRFNQVRVNFIRRNLISGNHHHLNQYDILKPLKALDIGCGAGILSEGLARIGVGSVTGIDPTDKCIELATAHLKE
jgi:ubiquinone biosynthesis O-methyltransferase